MYNAGPRSIYLDKDEFHLMPLRLVLRTLLNLNIEIPVLGSREVHNKSCNEQLTN